MVPINNNTNVSTPQTVQNIQTTQNVGEFNLPKVKLEQAPDKFEILPEALEQVDFKPYIPKSTPNYAGVLKELSNPILSASYLGHSVGQHPQTIPQEKIARFLNEIPADKREEAKALFEKSIAESCKHNDIPPVNNG